MLRHIVLVKFRSDVEETSINAALDQIVALREKIAGITAISTGANVSPEGLEKGFRHGFVVDFLDEASRDSYLTHPDHVIAGSELVRLADGGIDGILVFDYNY
ncbi:Dabb family protein [Brucella gallinifaecis]|uniref:Dabb family protein n=1 Tax=Brucella gallinifaecis TaxID=215590 RepID=A0A502BLM4_9HYPH|nr:Dabb family protein [Brucella gallinifaecis]TPF75372.1 Dabb family protein [Brucella gallinifaecis]